MYLTNRLSTLSANPAAVHQADIESQTNTSPSTEWKNVKNDLNQQIGDIEVVQIPRKTGLTKQTKTQDEDMTPGHVKAGTT